MMAHAQQNQMRNPDSTGSCGHSSRQSSRTDDGYDADCSSLSNFSDSSSLSSDAPKGINMNAPRRTRFIDVRDSRKQVDVSLDFRRTQHRSFEVVGFSPPRVDSSKSSIFKSRLPQDGKKNHHDTIATNRGSKRIPLPFDLLLPMKIADLRKIADVDNVATVSALDHSKHRLGGSASHTKGLFSGSESNFAVPLASPKNLPSESAVHTDGPGNENLRNKKETCISHVFPQWKNLRVVNPIDPRIDLSSVNLVNASTLHARSTENDRTVVKGGTEGTHPISSQEGYLKLMESCLPFFNAYTLSSERPTSNSEMRAAATKKAIEIGEVMLKYLESDGALSSQITSDDDKNSDAASILIRSRAQQKCQDHFIDQNDHESPSAKIPQGMNVSFPQNKLAFQSSSTSASSDRQHVPQCNGGARRLERESHQGQEVLQEHGQREQTSQGPRIVSDTLSSSANNGTSNGSGGSGNDTSGARQEAGGNSSNSDLRGDRMDACAKLRSLEESTRLNHARERKADAENIYLKGERHNYSLPNLAVSHGNGSHHFAISSTGGGKVTEVITSTAQTRLAMKKRKRMDRRREYEEVKRQFQETSESCESFAEELFCPGSLLSLEGALSFTKTARLIVQSIPPFLVVHANAAYMHLADFRPCSIVGKPISGLLSVVERIPNIGKKVSGDASIGGATIRKVSAMSTFNLQQNEANLSKYGVAQNKSAEICFDVLIASSELNQCYAVTLNKEGEGGKNSVYMKESRHNNVTKDENSEFSICLMSICPVGTSRPNLKEELKPMLSKDQQCNGSLGKQYHNSQVHNNNGASLRNMKQMSHCPKTDDITHYVVQLRPTDALSDFRSCDDVSVHSSFNDPNPVAACG